MNGGVQQSHSTEISQGHAFPLDEFDRGCRPVERDDKSDAAEDGLPAWDNEVPDGDLSRVETWWGEPDEMGRSVSEPVNRDGSM